MSRLLEVQQAIYLSLVGREDGRASEHIVADALTPSARLNIYRNTFIGSLTTALGLAYPAVKRLVGAAFFESAARLFIEAHPPRSAYLNDYGADFPRFLARFEPAASLPYLPDVAQLEWAVDTALHASDAEPLEVSALLSLDAADHGRVVFTPHPSISLVWAEHPADRIWHAVLAQDAAAMAAIEPESGPVWLLVQRLNDEVTTVRLKKAEWRFMNELCAGRSVDAAIDSVPEVKPEEQLAGHFAAGRFVGFGLADPADAPHSVERVA